jgi:hypothetical protein
VNGAPSSAKAGVLRSRPDDFGRVTELKFQQLAAPAISTPPDILAGPSGSIERRRAPGEAASVLADNEASDITVSGGQRLSAGGLDRVRRCADYRGCQRVLPVLPQPVDHPSDIRGRTVLAHFHFAV